MMGPAVWGSFSALSLGTADLAGRFTARALGADVELLADRFLQEAAQEMQVEAKHLTADARACLAACAWPGNVRELRNLCRRLTVMAAGPAIQAEDVDSSIGADIRSMSAENWEAGFLLWLEEQFELGTEKLLGHAQDQVQAVMLKAALRRTGGHRQAAARLLGCGRNTLTRRLHELGID